MAHYAKTAFDIQYEFPFGWQEIEGIHNRTDYDLSRHQKYSGKSLQYFDDETQKKILPYIIETSAGCDRSLLVFMADAYEEEKERVVLRFHPKLAPLKAAFFPLIKNPELQELAHKLQEALRPYYLTRYDEVASIGRRYRRHDEIGTPFCVTVDFDSLKDHAVTVRERDSMKQERVSQDQLTAYLRKKLEA